MLTDLSLSLLILAGIALTVVWRHREARLARAEKALQEEHRRASEAEQHLRQLSRAVEHSPASIMITDATGAIQYVNPKFCQLTGYSFEEVIGQNPRLLKSGETGTEAYGQLWATIRAGKEWRGEFHNKKKNGEMYWESASISAVMDAGGQVTHFVGVKEDITERKKAEAEREELIRRLESALANVKTLTGLLPICCGCKKIRDDQGYWNQVESYVAARSDARFSHGLCPDCAQRLYPEYASRVGL